ncbi:5763_t:CDS:2 [Diversispora eburnea]|uniref:Mitochondrial inner membrane protease ATP23 n=1 Tax=Diversispora eburnea TaxID=1213867 RepID=A0A9N8YNI3_9GLOM|nr:5763_t:CDS:2 [Diversispora eburnea]
MSSAHSTSNNDQTKNPISSISPVIINEQIKEKDKRIFEKWRKKLMYITGMGLTEQEKAEYKIELKNNYEEYQCERCPIVVFMLKSLEEAGCKIEKKHFKCLPCDNTRSGGFSPDHGILLCQNRFFSKSHAEDTMVHEMMHFYDHCRFKVDWNNCYHHACSEIRAASLSGDCRWTREIRRGFFNFTKQHQACVKRRAILSVQKNSQCSAPGVAERVVSEVFESCFNDTRPFDEIY